MGSDPAWHVNTTVHSNCRHVLLPHEPGELLMPAVDVQRPIHRHAHGARLQSQTAVTSSVLPPVRSAPCGEGETAEHIACPHPWHGLDPAYVQNAAARPLLNNHVGPEQKVRCLWCDSLWERQFGQSSANAAPNTGWLEAAVLVPCRVAVLIGVMRLDSWAALSMVPGAWSVSCADRRSFGLIVGVLCSFLCSWAVPGVCSFLHVTLQPVRSRAATVM